MKPHRVIVAVGSNIEPEKNVAEAKRILAAEQELVATSSFSWTDPVGFQDQDRFLNGAFLVGTHLDERALKSYLQGVEVRLGRVKGPIKSGPRTMDLDIVIFDGRVVHDDYNGAAYVQKPVRELVERFDLSLQVLPEDPSQRKD